MSAFSVGLDSALSDAMRALLDRVLPSVVDVSSDGHGNATGVVWRREGLIATNQHVAPMKTAMVTLPSGQQVRGPVVARDVDNDLAIVDVQTNLSDVALAGNARALRPGELVAAVGHPYGMRKTVTVGVVMTAPRRSAIERRRELVFADVLLGPGNSGGPLVDARGHVVGINAMVSGHLAMAVPSHLVERLVSAHVGDPVLGFVAKEVALEGAFGRLVPSSQSGSATGVMVYQVHGGSPAEAAGMLIGDIVVSVNGGAVGTADALLDAVSAARPGAPVALGLIRGGVFRYLDLVPGRRAGKAA